MWATIYLVFIEYLLPIERPIVKKLKIIFDANPLLTNKSGVGYFTQELITQMAIHLDKKVSLKGYYFNFLKRKNISLPAAPNVTYVESTFMPAKLLNATRRLGFQAPLELFTMQRSDVVLFPNFVSLPLVTDAVKVIAVHDLCFIDCPQYVSERNTAFLQRWVPRSVQTADIVLTISEFTKQRIIDVYDIKEEKIHVMPIPPQTPAAPDEKILQTYKLKKSKYLLFVGTIEPRKNIVGLLKAYDHLPQQIKPEYPLVLVGGKGWNDEEIIALIKDLSKKKLKIIQTGYVSDAEKAALYQSASAVVQPSHYEGFGMPILEAMSYGKPVLCSDIAVFHEVGGNAPLFFDKDNPSDMANVISKLLKDPKKIEMLSKKSRQRIREFTNWQSVIQNFYDRIIVEV